MGREVTGGRGEGSGRGFKNLFYFVGGTGNRSLYTLTGAGLRGKEAKTAVQGNIAMLPLQRTPPKGGRLFVIQKTQAQGKGEKGGGNHPKKKGATVFVPAFERGTTHNRIPQSCWKKG